VATGLRSIVFSSSSRFTHRISVVSSPSYLFFQIEIGRVVIPA
jgi:hypothetical protein